jgi:hypothetical protein
VTKPQDSGRYYPNLKGKVDPDVEEAVRILYDQVHALHQTKANMKDAATRKMVLNKASDVIGQITDKISQIPSYDFFESGSSGSVKKSQTSVLPTISGAFTYANTGNSITWSWANRKLRWPNLDVDGVPDGGQAATGLALSTAYQFYPRFSLDRGVFEFVAATNGVGTEKVAYTTKDDEAAQLQTSDRMTGVSIGGMSASTTGGGGGAGGSGGGSGCIHEDMVVERDNGLTMRLADAKIGNLIMGPHGINMITNIWDVDENIWVELMPRMNERPWVTASHPLIWRDGHKSALDWSMRDLLLGRDEQMIMMDGIKLHHTKPMRGRAIECLPDHAFLFGEHTAFCVSHNLPVGK